MSVLISNHCAHVYVAVQHLSTLPPNEWTDSVTEDGELETQPMKELIKLKTAFAQARRLLREMGEVERNYSLLGVRLSFVVLPQAEETCEEEA